MMLHILIPGMKIITGQVPIMIIAQQVHFLLSLVRMDRFLFALIFLQKNGMIGQIFI